MKGVYRKFNLNGYVRVKLNQHGKQLYSDYWSPYAWLKEPEIDDEGYTQFQMWQLMNIFGTHLYNGCKTPFETTILIPMDELE
jgi:hypothetical protein